MMVDFLLDDMLLEVVGWLKGGDGGGWFYGLLIKC